ncbi:MAG TPA: SPOR domain-containing protein [Desulfonatronum sp.]|nr:SPOR domain-containing protein [Desulfonatronum sp.]
MAQKSQKTSSGPGKRWKYEFGPAGMVGLCSVVALIMAWAFILGILVGRGYKPESVISELSGMLPELGKSPSAPAAPRPLLPEELRFFDSLQEKSVPVMPAAPPRKEAAQAMPSADHETRSAPPPPAAAPSQPLDAEPVEPRFEFVYQVAAFQTDAQARALQQRLSEVGGTTSLEVSVQDGRPWYRVLVTLRGSATDAEHLKNRLRTHGVTDPFLRAKKSL